MREPIIKGVASISRLWLSLGCKSVSIRNLPAFLDAVTKRNKAVSLLTVSNHISTVDDPVMWGALLQNHHIFELLQRDMMRYTVAAEEIVFCNPFFRWFFNHGQVISIVRGAGLTQPGMQASQEILDTGRWLHFFPEGRVVQGSREKEDDIGRLKWGIGQLLLNCPLEVLVMPIILRGFDQMKPLDGLPRLSKSVEILIGDPVSSIELKRVADEGEVDLSLRRSKITELVQQMMNKLSLQ